MLALHAGSDIPAGLVRKILVDDVGLSVEEAKGYSEEEMTTAMDVRLLVHLEDGSDGSLVWWGDVPELPGFSVTAETLAELISRAHWALADVLADEGRDLGDVAVFLVQEGPLTGNPVVSRRNDDEHGATTGDQVSVASVARSPVGVAVA